MGAFRDGTINVKRKTRRRAPVLPSKSESRLADQRDVIAAWQLADDGFSDDNIESAVDLGLFRPLPGRVFTTWRSPLDTEARRWAGLLSGGREGRLTAATILAMAGIREQEPSQVHVVVPGEAARKCPGVRRYRSTKLPDADRRLWNGMPGTTVARALVDAAADSTIEELEEDLDRATMLGLFDEAAVTRARRARPRLEGMPKLKTALATLDEHSGNFRSLFERKVTRLVQQSTVIGAVEVNVLVTNYRPDIHPVGSSAIIECDGRDYHRSLAQIAADEVREERLRELGYFILRLRWAQLRYEPQRTLELIEAFVLAHPGPPVPRVPIA